MKEQLLITTQLPNTFIVEENSTQLESSPYPARYLSSGTRYYNYFLYSGGALSGLGTRYSDFHAWSPETGWFSLATLPTSRFAHRIVWRPGTDYIYLLGGCNGVNTNYLKDNYIYDFSTNKFTRLADIPETKSYHYSYWVNDKLYVIGGYNSKSCYCYNPNLDNWVQLSSLPVTMISDGNVGGVYGNNIYIADGSGNTSDVYKYNPSLDQWTLIGSSGIANSRLTGAMIDGVIYFAPFSGSTGNIKYYNVLERKSYTSSIIFPAFSNTPAVAYETYILFFGGIASSYSNKFYRYGS